MYFAKVRCEPKKDVSSSTARGYHLRQYSLQLPFRVNKFKLRVNLQKMNSVREVIFSDRLSV